MIVFIVHTGPKHLIYRLKWVRTTMGKIVAISCSPRNDGSSIQISDAFLDGAMGLSTNIVTLHRPTKFKSMQDCTRCMACKGTGRCKIDDDLTVVLDDIAEADCVVFSTPLYFNGPTATYKIIEDRMYSFLDKDRKSVLKPGKKAVLIISSCYPESDLKKAADILTSSLELIGFEMLGVITYCDQRRKMPAGDNPELMHEAKELGAMMRNTPTV